MHRTDAFTHLPMQTHDKERISSNDPAVGDIERHHLALSFLLFHFHAFIIIIIIIIIIVVIITVDGA